MNKEQKYGKQSILQRKAAADFPFVVFVSVPVIPAVIAWEWIPQ